VNVLVACEFSGRVRDAFIALGHNAISCDLLPTELPGPHYQGDIKDILYNNWDLLIGHPPCTYLTNAGVRHLHDHVTSKNGNRTAVYGWRRWQQMAKACEFFNLLQDAPIDKICIENPIPHRYAKYYIGNYNQIIQPWQFGHGETKKTCLWLKNLPLLQPTNIVAGRYPACHMTPPSKDRWKIRSLTYQGIADGMAAQWG
jgi:hypothetical protein